MLRRLLLGMLLLVLLLVAAGGALVWRLQRGPVSLAAFSPLINRLVAASSPFAISFSNPELAWLREEGNLGIQVDDVEVRTKEGEFVASAPSASATVALRPLLTERQVQPVAVELQLPEIELNLHKSGPPSLSFAGQAATLPATEAAGPGGLAAFLGDTSAAQDPRLASLQLLRVSAPLLQVYNEASGELADATDPVFELRRDGDAWSVSFAAALDKGRVAVRLVPSKGAGSAPQHLSVDLFRAPLEMVSALYPTVPLEGLKLPISGGLSVDLSADASLGPGKFDVDIDPTTLDLKGILEQPIVLKSASFEGEIAAGLSEVKLTAAEIVTDRFSLVAQANAKVTADLVTGSATVTPKGLSATDIPSLWPLTAGGDGRKWVKENVLAGTPSAAAVQFSVPLAGGGKAQPTVSGSFAFANASVRYLDAFPPAQGLSGNATFDLDTMRFTIGPGKTGDVEIQKGEVGLKNMSKPTPTLLDTKLDLRSDVPPALKLLDLPPLELLKGTDLPLQRASGTQTSKVTLALPLKDKVGDFEITYRADVTLKGLGLTEVKPGYSISDGDLTVTARPNSLDAKGKASVNGVPVTVTYDEQLVPKKGLSRKANVKADLDVRGAKALQIPWPTQLTGSAGTNLDVTLPKGKGSPRYDLNLDLKRVGIQAPELVFEKMTGTPGKLAVTATQPDAKTVSLDAVWLQLPGLNGKGSARIGLEPTVVQRLKVDRVDMPLGGLAIDLDQRDGALRGSVTIDRLDLRPILDKLPTGGGGGGDPMPNVDIRVTAKEFRIGEAPLKNLNARIVKDSGGWGPVNIAAKMEANNDLSLDLVRGKATSTLNAKASDAGWLFRSLSSGQAQYEGGRVRATATIRQTPTFRADGELKVRGFTIASAPVLARILTLASFSGLTNALSGQGIPIDRLTVPFAYENSVLTIEELRLVGSQIGARAEGTVNLAQDTLKINGTVAPAYTINRILGRIPIVGNILRGDKADAALAATFSISGSISNPQVFVNPLAALVPGMVRDLFNALSDNASPTAGPLDSR